MRAGAPPGLVISLGDVLARQAAIRGSDVFAVLADGSLTYAEADERAHRFASWLCRIGCVPGTIVASHCGPTISTLMTWFGCARAGVVWMPLHPLFEAEPLRRILAETTPAVLIVDGERAERLSFSGLAPLAARVVVTGKRGFGQAPALDTELRATRLSGVVAPNPNGPAKVLYTSGTTGEPKGVVWTRGCEDTWAEAYANELIDIRAGETVYSCLPISHVTCQGTVLAALWRGGRVVLDARFEPFGFWQRLRDVDARVFTFVGTLLAALARRPPRPDDHANPVRRILGAGAPASSWRAIEQRFGLHIAETWGQTETASCWMSPRILPQRVGTVGYPSDRFDAALVTDGTDRDAAGVLRVRPRQPNLMFSHYLGGETSDVFDADGWYLTGDVLRREPDDSYVFLGRARDAIRRRGEMIAPSIIEQCAEAYPGVVEAAAVAVADDWDVEEEILLCIVTDDRAGDVIPPLRRHLSRCLPRHMRPRYIRVLSELPKTPSSRVQRHRLRADGVVQADDAVRRRSPNA